MSNALIIVNQFPSQSNNPNANLIFIDVNGDGSVFQLSLDVNPSGLYPSDPDDIVAGAAVQMSPTGGEVLLKTTDLVNLNTATPQVLSSAVPTGFQAVITRIVVRNASTSLTTVSFSIGWNSASFNNVLANATHTELTGATLFTSLSSKVGATKGVAGDILRLLNNTLQGGAATCSIDIFGYYLSV